MKKQSETGKATVKDFSLVDASVPDGPRNDGSKEVDVDYSYDYDEIETAEELNKEFSEKDLIALANARLKSTANSSARQKAIAPYAQDPNAPAAVKERMIKDAMKLGKSREVAEQFVDSLLGA